MIIDDAWRHRVRERSFKTPENNECVTLVWDGSAAHSKHPISVYTFVASRWSKVHQCVSSFQRTERKIALHSLQHAQYDPTAERWYRLCRQTYESLCIVCRYSPTTFLPDYSSLLPAPRPPPFPSSWRPSSEVLHLLSGLFPFLEEGPLFGLPARYTKTVRLRFEGRRVFHWRSSR